MSSAPLSEQEAQSLAQTFDLPKLGGRPNIGTYVRKLWERRHFTLELARSRFRAANEADRLGILWTVLLPLINAAVYGLIFGLVFNTKGKMGSTFIPFLVIGVFSFQFFAACLADGAKAILSNKGLVRTMHFPRALLPIASVLQQTYALVPMTAVMCLVVLFSPGQGVQLTWLKLPLAMGLLILFCMGVAFIAARLTIHVRDIAQLIPFVSRVLFYLSGVFFSIDQRAEKMLNGSPDIWHHLAVDFLRYNPLNIYLSLIRDALLADVDGVPHTTLTTWGLAAAWAIGLSTFGFWYCWRAEELYGRD